ncbi:MAG: hypothetical protein IJX87_06585 [Clostridia bacterium]|nr:hypothetical protein [Clostridia bacterium]
MEQNGIFTKADGLSSVATEQSLQGANTYTDKQNDCLTLSAQEAEEYRAYKRRKKVEQVMAAIGKSGTALLCGEDAQRICERALRLKQAAVKVAPSRLSQVKTYLEGSKVRIDCVIGGNGETLTRVKGYEIKQALKNNAGELSVLIAPSYLATCRYTEIKKELKQLSRAAKKAIFKVCVDRFYSQAVLSRIARISGEVGAKYFCVPYYDGCEKLRFDLTNGCRLEVTGVETLADFQKMTDAGVGRIVTTNIWEIYSEWMREAEKVTSYTPVIAVGNVSEKRENSENQEKPNGQEKQEKEEKTAQAQSAQAVKTKEEETQNVPLKVDITTKPCISDPPKNLPVSLETLPKASACLQLPVKKESKSEEGLQRCRTEVSDLKFL